MDAIYLHNKFSKPCSWDMYHPFIHVSDIRWLKVRKIADYVCDHWKIPDMYFLLLIRVEYLGPFGKYVPRNRCGLPNQIARTSI